MRARRDIRPAKSTPRIPSLIFNLISIYSLLRILTATLRKSGRYFLILRIRLNAPLSGRY